MILMYSRIVEFSTTPLARTYHLFHLNADLRVIRKDIGHLTFSGEDVNEWLAIDVVNRNDVGMVAAGTGQMCVVDLR